MHWDGDDLLYQTTTTGAIEIMIEKLARVYPTGTTELTVDDRDWTGTAIEMHDVTGFSALSPTGNFPYVAPSFKSHSVWEGSPANYSSADKEFALSALRSDGYYDGINVFQGVRAYDPNSNQWTTPDAYSGDVHDPMSQHPYVWNANNSMVYADPSGYTVEVDDDDKTFNAETVKMIASMRLASKTFNTIYEKLDAPGTIVHIQKAPDNGGGTITKNKDGTLTMGIDTSVSSGHQRG